MILLKQGEIVLKGLNRRAFEQKLLGNIQRRLRPFGPFRVHCIQSTVYVEPQADESDMDAAFDAMTKVFGVVSVSRAAACEKDKDAIFRCAREYLAGAMAEARSFKVETKRSDKRFPMTSIQLSQYVGGLLAEAFPEVKGGRPQPGAHGASGSPGLRRLCPCRPHPRGRGYARGQQRQRRNAALRWY